MRILQVGKFYWPHRGGIETVLQSICEGLAVRGVEVEALVANGGLRTVRENVRNVPITRVGTLGVVCSTPLCPRMPAEIRSRRSCICHLHMPNPMGEGALLLTRGGRKFIVTYHSDVVRQKLLKYVRAPVMRAVLERASRITVATPNHIKFSTVLRDFASKCVVVPYGIDPSKFRVTETVGERVRKLRTEGRSHIILSVGRLIGYKGFSYLIRAMTSVNANLVIIGGGPLMEGLSQQVRQLDLDGKVRLAGEVPQQDLIAWYNACDVFVLPSVTPNEAFGMVQLEAMACGKPVVSTNLKSGVPHVNHHGRTGYVVPPRNPEALAARINELLSDSALRREMGQAGKKRVESEYTIDKMVSGFLKLYEEIEQE